MGRIEQKAN